jgi:hypothetical protein
MRPEEKERHILEQAEFLLDKLGKVAVNASGDLSYLIFQVDDKIFSYGYTLMKNWHINIKNKPNKRYGTAIEVLGKVPIIDDEVLEQLKAMPKRDFDGIQHYGSLEGYCNSHNWLDLKEKNSCILLPNLKECQGCEHYKSETLGSMGIVENSDTPIAWCSFLNVPIEDNEK